MSRVPPMPPVHPAAEVYRMMSDAELDELAADIKKRGLRVPVVMYGAQLLDGRNRWRACERAGVEVTLRDYNGNDPIGEVVSLNERRRHDPPAQKAVAAVKVEALYAAETAKGRPKGSKNSVGNQPNKKDDSKRSLAQAAKKTGASLDSAKKMKAVAKAAPEVIDLVQSGQVATVADAERVAVLPAPQRAEVVEMVRDGARVAEAIKQTGAATPMQRIAKEAESLCKHASATATASGRLIELCRLAGASISGLELAVAKGHLLTSRSKITQVLDAMEARDEARDQH